MQDKYVGDIGDFGKFHLFRFLFDHEESPLYGKSLSQIWYMHEGEGEKNNDGRHIDYFQRIMGSDQFLEESLSNLLKNNQRQVTQFEALKLLQNAKFYYEHVPKVLEERHSWLNRALRFSNNVEVVAVEPDNGMALKCQREEKRLEILTLEEHHDQKSFPHKYIFAEEVKHFYELPQLEVCIVYQHLNRCFSHNEQIIFLLNTLREVYAHVIAIKHKPYSPRVFFFLCKSENIKSRIQIRLQDFENVYSEFWEVFK